ncbi:MAG: hypothetical protein LBB38_00065 [Puniceicoccales bacterium]|nr:hypothetical protein [Puniceicoccales bacterium]
MDKTGEINKSQIPFMDNAALYFAWTFGVTRATLAQSIKEKGFAVGMFTGQIIAAVVLTVLTAGIFWLIVLVYALIAKNFPTTTIGQLLGQKHLGTAKKPKCDPTVDGTSEVAQTPDDITMVADVNESSVSPEPLQASQVTQIPPTPPTQWNTYLSSVQLPAGVPNPAPPANVDTDSAGICITNDDDSVQRLHLPLEEPSSIVHPPCRLPTGEERGDEALSALADVFFEPFNAPRTIAGVGNKPVTITSALHALNPGYTKDFVYLLLRKEMVVDDKLVGKVSGIASPDERSKAIIAEFAGDRDQLASCLQLRSGIDLTGEHRQLWNFFVDRLFARKETMMDLICGFMMRRDGIVQCTSPLYVLDCKSVCDTFMEKFIIKFRAEFRTLPCNIKMQISALCLNWEKLLLCESSRHTWDKVLAKIVEIGTGSDSAAHSTQTIGSENYALRTIGDASSALACRIIKLDPKHSINDIVYPDSKLHRIFAVIAGIHDKCEKFVLDSMTGAEFNDCRVVVRHSLAVVTEEVEAESFVDSVKKAFEQLKSVRRSEYSTATEFDYYAERFAKYKKSANDYATPLAEAFEAFIGKYPGNRP